MKKSLRTKAMAVALFTGVASSAYIVGTAGVASATIDTAHLSYGRWVNTPHEGRHWMGLFWEYDRAGHKVLVVCSNSDKPYATTTVGNTTIKLSELKPGGTATVYAMVNQFMHTVHTADEGEAFNLAVRSESTEPAVRADQPWVLSHANAHVRALYHKYVDFGNNHRGPYDETIHSAYVHNSGGKAAKVTLRLTSSNGHAMPGLKPRVTASNAVVSSVTATNSKGVASYVLTARGAGSVRTTAVFTGLPDWRTVTGGYVKGHQHFSGGHHVVNIKASTSFGYHGVATAAVKSLCDNDCDTTVPVSLSGKNPGGLDTMRAQAVDTATGKVVGYLDIAPGHTGSKTIQLANGDGKTLQLEWFYLSHGKRSGSIHFVKKLTIVCPPKPQISITVNCGCTSNAASSTISTLSGATETYTATFYEDGVLKYTKVLTNGTSYTYTWSKAAVGDSLETDVTAVDANKVTHKWDREVTINK